MKKIYYIKINDDISGMDAISLVDYPAVGYNFLKFDKDEPIELKFNDEQHIITGVVCLADTPIYRYTEGLGEWYCVFTKDVIKQMIVKYSKENLWNKINLQHDDDKFVDGVYMLESYIKDESRGVVPAEFKDVPDGSWIASFYVQNDELWDEIKKDNGLNGFSLQGHFDLAPSKESFNDEHEDEDELDEQFNEFLKRVLG